LISADRSCKISGVPELPSIVELMERLAALEKANVELRAEVYRLQAENTELRRRLGLTSRTSSKPPSADGLGKPPPRSRREPSGRLPGKQPGDPGFTLRQVTDPDRVLVHRPDVCEGCGVGLRRAPVTSVEVRQVFDLPPVKVSVTEHRVQHRRCRCGTVTMAGVPAGVTAPVQYGPKVKAVAAYLVGYQHLPYERAAETLTDLLGVGMSSGTLAAVVAAAGQSLEGFCDTVRAALAAAPVAHFDETGLRVAGGQAWVHSASTDTLSLFTVHASRGHEGIQAARVLPSFAGVAVHDGFTPYRRYATAHQLCNAHHLRELAAIVETDPDRQGWAERMITLLCEMNDMARYTRQVGADAIGGGVLAMWRRRYDEAIAAGRTANPDPGGQQARSPAANLIARLSGFAADVLRFTTDLRVPFDNNLAERDIRMVKLRQKISGGLRTWAGAQMFCAIRSYLSTARKHGIGALEALTQLHNGQCWLPGTS
jgi:transposase